MTRVAAMWEEIRGDPLSPARAAAVSPARAAAVSPAQTGGPHQTGGLTGVDFRAPGAGGEIGGEWDDWKG